jgi:cytochrome P450
MASSPLKVSYLTFTGYQWCMSSNIFLADSEHKSQRKMLNPHFAPTNMRSLMPVFAAVADDVRAS